MSRGKSSQTLEEGFNKFVIKNDEGCWGWNGDTSQGYGRFRHTMKQSRAHRASWIIHNGPIPKGMSILHKCDNRICSNPDHLFLGTQRDNMLDAIKKGRLKVGRRGEACITSKLKLKDVVTIKKLISDKVPYPKIAQMYNVTPSTICSIRKERVWKGV